ncbi:MAG: ExeM/NucH family extracellular endonuclease [Gaiellaceae bacterium]
MGRRSLTALVAFAFIMLSLPVGAKSAAAAGTISLTAIGVAYTETFDTLANTGIANTVTPDGWAFSETGTNANTTYAAGAGSSTAGNTYSFGTDLSAERAFGGLQSGTLNPTIGASFINSTGADLTRIDISYVGEQWRLGALGRPDRIDFQWSTNATSLVTGTWTDADALDFAAPVTTGAVGQLNGNLPANRTAVSSFILAAVPAGTSFWIRWSSFDATGSDDGLAVDDFSLTPRVSDQAPFITATSPLSGAANVALDADITVTFSEAVNTTGAWYLVACATSGAHSATASGGPTTFTLDPATNFAANESCTVTVVAARVTDQDTADPPDTMAADFTFTFQTADVLVCGAPATPIHAVQGSGLASPIVGTLVTIEGVVVGDYQPTPSQFGGFFLQEEAADFDADPLTSEGVFVFDNGFGVNVNPGDVVRVRGRATEFSGLTEVASVNAVAICSSGSSVSATPVSLPVANVADLERFEGMLVGFSQTLTATEVFNLGRFGEVSLSGAGRLYTPTAVAAPGAPAQAVLAQNDRSRIILDDGDNLQNIDPTRYPQGGLSATNTLRVGDTLAGLTGVMDFRFGNYRIQPVGPIAFDHTNPRTSAPAPLGGNLKVASFNVLNFFNGDGLGGGFPTARGANTSFELQRQLAKEVSALSAMNADIVGLMEIENDAPPHSAIEDLVAGLNAAMGAGTYSFINTGIIGTDAIRVALIYKPSAVSPRGVFKTITTAVDPRFIDNLNRPSLAQTFQQNASGQTLTVVVNHLKSKGSDCNAVGDPDTGDGQGNCNVTRTNAAEALVDWLATDPTDSGDPDFLLIGDMNSYTFEDPITAFTNGGFTNLVREFGGLTAYSYVFNGESGYLDHGLATSSLAAQVTGVTDWHINPDEPTVLDYNTEFKTANQVNTFYSSGPYRSSDHDPVVIGIHFNMAPTADAGGPYTVAEGGSVTLSASGSDADGDGLSYAWDLDNNGTYETPGQSVTFSAANLDGPSTRTVKVSVSDGDRTTVATATVNVMNVAPTASAGGPYAGVPFGAVTFSGSASDPAGPRDVLTYSWDFDYNGTFAADVSGVDLTAPSHAYASPGTYTVALRVTDDDGGVSSLATASVVIGAPTRTEGKVEGSPTWEQGIKTKLNVDAKNGELKGRVDIEGTGGSYASTRLDSLVVTGSDATIFGAFGSTTFRIDVHDGGPNGSDTVRIRTSDGYDSGVLTDPHGNVSVKAN